MANYGYSDAQDLMVGAGVLSFSRLKDDGTYDEWHHLGNCEEFNITTDITTVEKNSSMNKRRELMARVVTAVSATGSITMNEYDPYNLALGLFGTTGVHNQPKQQFTSVAYKVNRVPGLLYLTDANGNTLYNVENIKVAPSTATLPSVKIQSGPSAGSITTTTNASDTFTDANGNEFVFNGAGYSGGSTQTYMITLNTPNSGVSDTAGLVLDVQAWPLGATTQVTATGGSATETLTLPNGITVTVTADPSNTVSFSGSIELIATPATTTYTENVDYQADEQFRRAGGVQIPETSKIKEGDTVLISYEVPEDKFVTISGGSAGEISGRLRYIGDPNVGPRYVIEGWKVKVTPEGDLTGLIGTDFGTFTLNVAFEADYQHHADAPYYKVTQVGKQGTIYVPGMQA